MKIIEYLRELICFLLWLIVCYVVLLICFFLWDLGTMYKWIEVLEEQVLKTTKP